MKSGDQFTGDLTLQIRRGRKAIHDKFTGALAFLELFAAAAAGAGTAVLIDFGLSSTGSVLRLLAELLEQATANSITPAAAFAMAAVGLIALGGASILYFRPLNWKGGFASGFCAVAVLAIFTP